MGTEGAGVFTLGSGLTFVKANVLWEEKFKNYGMSYEHFLKWLKLIHVPILYLGQERFVRLLAFKTALAAISRVGEEDFATPGHTNYLRSNKKRIRERTELDLVKFEREKQAILAEVLYSLGAVSQRVTTTEAKQIDMVMMRMLAWKMQLEPLIEQKRADHRRIVEMRRQLKAGNLPEEVIDGERDTKNSGDESLSRSIGNGVGGERNGLHSERVLSGAGSGHQKSESTSSVESESLTVEGEDGYIEGELGVDEGAEDGR